MYRRSLVVRRFGAASFGLGYLEDGVWVDHSVAAARGEDLLADASPADLAALDAFHTWFSCCGAGVADGAAREGRAFVAIVGSATS